MMSGWLGEKLGHVTRIPHPVSPYWLGPACRRLGLGSIKYKAETGSELIRRHDKDTAPGRREGDKD